MYTSLAIIIDIDVRAMSCDSEFVPVLLFSCFCCRTVVLCIWFTVYLVYCLFTAIVESVIILHVVSGFVTSQRTLHVR